MKIDEIERIKRIGTKMTVGTGEAKAHSLHRLVRCLDCKHWCQDSQWYPKGGPLGCCDKICDGITVHDDSQPVQTEENFGCVYGEESNI